MKVKFSQMSKVKKFLGRYLWKATVRNYSSKILWVIETTTKKKGFHAVAHQLKPGMKSQKKIDGDGFRRFDNGVIEGHREWWKIENHFQAYVYDKSRGLKALVVLYKRKVSMKEFGEKIFYDPSNHWGEKIIHIVDVDRDKEGKIKSYFVEEKGWVVKDKAISLALI